MTRGLRFTGWYCIVREGCSGGCDGGELFERRRQMDIPPRSAPFMPAGTAMTNAPPFGRVWDRNILRTADVIRAVRSSDSFLERTPCMMAYFPCVQKYQSQNGQALPPNIGTFRGLLLMEHTRQSQETRRVNRRKLAVFRAHHRRRVCEHGQSLPPIVEMRGGGNYHPKRHH